MTRILYGANNLSERQIEPCRQIVTDLRLFNDNLEMRVDSRPLDYESRRTKWQGAASLAKRNKELEIALAEIRARPYLRTDPIYTFRNIKNNLQRCSSLQGLANLINSWYLTNRDFCRTYGYERGLAIYFMPLICQTFLVSLALALDSIFLLGLISVVVAPILEEFVKRSRIYGVFNYALIEFIFNPGILRILPFCFHIISGTFSLRSGIIAHSFYNAVVLFYAIYSNTSNPPTASGFLNFDTLTNTTNGLSSTDNFTFGVFFIVAIPLHYIVTHFLTRGNSPPFSTSIVIAFTLDLLDPSGGMRNEALICMAMRTLSFVCRQAFLTVALFQDFTEDTYRLVIDVFLSPILEEIAREFSSFGGIGIAIMEFHCQTEASFSTVLRFCFHMHIARFTLFERLLVHTLWNIYGVFCHRVIPASFLGDEFGNCKRMLGRNPMDYTFLADALGRIQQYFVKFVTDELLSYFSPIPGTTLVGIERAVLFFLSLCQQTGVTGLITTTLQYASAISQRSLITIFSDFIKRVPQMTGFKSESYMDVSNSLDWILDSSSSFLKSPAHKWLRTVITGCLCVPMFHSLSLEFNAKQLGLFERDTARLYGSDKVSFVVSVTRAVKACIHTAVMYSQGKVNHDIFTSDSVYSSFMASASELRTKEPYIHPGASTGDWINNREYRTKLISAITLGRDVVQQIRSHPDVDSQQRSIVNSALKDLEKIEAKLLVKDKASQKHPAFILLCVGAPGVGKTVVMNHIHQTMERVKGRAFSPDAVANLMPDVEFYDNISNGTCIIHFDEIGIEKPQGGRLDVKNSSVRMLLNYGDSNPQVVNKSDVTEKGKTYNLNDYVTGSTNTFNINAQYVTKIPEAIYRRIHWIEVKVEESYRAANSNGVDVQRLKDEGLPLTSKFLIREVVFPHTKDKFSLDPASGEPRIRDEGPWVSLPEYLLMLEARIKQHDERCKIGAGVTMRWDEHTCPHGRTSDICLDCQDPAGADILRRSLGAPPEPSITYEGDGGAEEQPESLDIDQDDVDDIESRRAVKHPVNRSVFSILFAFMWMIFGMFPIILSLFSPFLLWLVSRSLWTVAGWWYASRSTRLIDDYTMKLSLFGKSMIKYGIIDLTAQIRGYETDQDRYERRLCTSVTVARANNVQWYLNWGIRILIVPASAGICLSIVRYMRTRLSHEGMAQTKMLGEKLSPSEFTSRLAQMNVTTSRMTPTGERNSTWSAPSLMTVQTAEKSILPPDHLLNKLRKHVWSIQAIRPDGTAMNAHALAVCPEIILVNTHVFAGSLSIILEHHVCSSGEIATMVNRLVYNNLSDRDSFDIGNDITAVYVAGLTSKNFLGYIPDALEAQTVSNLWSSVKIPSFQVFPTGVREIESHFGRDVPVDDTDTIVQHPIMYSNPNHANGMCGIPLVQVKGSVTVLAGFHFGGASKDGDATCAATSFVRPQIESAIAKLRQNRTLAPLASEGEVQPFDLDGIDPEFGLPGPRSFLNWQRGNIGYAGTVKNMQFFSTSPKMTFLPTAPYADMLGVPTKNADGEYLWGVPDFRAHPDEKSPMGYYSPYHKWAEKAFQSSPVMHVERVEKAVENFWEKISDANIKWEARPLDITSVCAGDSEVASLHKMNAKASMGFGWKGKKSDHMYPISTDQAPDGRMLDDDVLGHVMEVLKIYSSGETACPMAKGSLKVEARPRQEDGSIKPPRVFCATPISDVVIGRMFLLPLTNLMREDLKSFECAVGINATSKDWGKFRKIFEDLGVLLQCFGADISGFDTRMLLSIKHGAMTIIIRMAEKCGWSEDELTILRAYLTDRLWPHIIIENDILVCKNIQISGQVATAEFNSLCLSIIYRLVFDLIKESYNPTANFNKEVALGVYGDDSKAGPRLKWFDQKNFCQGCSYFGIKATTASKSTEFGSFVPFDGEEFLHRTWRWDEEYQVYCAPLALESMARSLVLNNTSQIGEKMQALESARSINYELAQHGREVFEEKMVALKKILESADLLDLLLSSPFKSYDEIMESCYGSPP